ncbi:MAG: phospholipase D-like domain-containing protein [Myxococcota bacterium]|nr:phospholipase D-like domain-containing protein [Myxococcota bacterium]
MLATADDERLSRGERRALRQLLTERPPSDGERAVLRHQLVEAVIERLHDPRDKELVAWLGDALALLEPHSRPQAEARAWFGPGDPMVETLVSAIQACRDTLDVAVFTITDDRLSEALVARHRAGVQIRILTDDDKAHDRGSDAHRLARAGVPLFMDRSEHHFHHKFAIFDGQRLYNGSYNWTRSAAAYNEENIVVTTDPRLTHAFAETFQRLWKAFA